MSKSIDIIEAAKQTHEIWADYFKKHPEDQNKGEFIHVGDLKRHTKYITNYNEVIIELAANSGTVKHLRNKLEFNMPDDMIGQYFNACTDSCDIIEGPCACGAWHNVKEWIYKLSKYVKQLKAELKKLSWLPVDARYLKNCESYFVIVKWDSPTKPTLSVEMTLWINREKGWENWDRGNTRITHYMEIPTLPKKKQ